ncbi:hypothetical protein JRQ81_007289 [Phrynocephalus forsythii]|uniref:Uncharacterized protein n=1 Tax=Phrynocephalus forsythii TaxID=171643 RepID=A0A9Q0XDV2_9SAUR|nr:hypothetical protein JRQ81_007289 [Phrynocephalus forsythii]
MAIPRSISEGLPGLSSMFYSIYALPPQKQLPDEIKKCPLKLPSYKSTSASTQVPQIARGAVAGVASTYVGLEHNTTCAENEAPGTRLPVWIAGDNKISKIGAQKRPLEKPADSASVQKPPLPKQACQG